MSILKIRFYWLLIGLISVITIEALWIQSAYKLKYQQLQIDIKDAFIQAYQKEQTYRIPVADIINPGAVTIQSCGTEEIFIIRNCPEPDTTIYNNISGYPIENFMNRVFGDLRELVVPMNINCLSDLFAGMLYDKNIPVHFVIERFNTKTGEVLESSLLPEEERQKMHSPVNISLEISEKESIRAIYELTPGIILESISGLLIGTGLLTALVLTCLLRLYFYGRRNKKGKEVLPQATEERGNSFILGQYIFDPAKNELSGFEKTVQLNKKENTILHALCQQKGNVVERVALLEENWGDNGLIYSRSLDTYITTLRKYLKDDPSIQIITIKGLGYKLTD